MVGAFVLVLLLLVGLRRLTTEDTPPLLLHRTLPAYVRLPGSAPALAWPEEGQAAVEVEGVGSLGSVGGSAPVPIASVAKVMTAYLTLREHPLASGQEGFSVTITPADAAEEEQREALGESTLNVRAGERLSERQMLQALLLPSANNIAALLARYEAGGIAPFVARMNATARTLGMASSTYTDPSGFNDETVSTAGDQLKLARVVMRIPAFAEIVDEHSVVLPVVGRVANFNGLVGEDGYVGVKTGSDRAAGGCLIFAKRVLTDGRALTVLGVVLNQRGGSLIQAALVSARQLRRLGRGKPTSQNGSPGWYGRAECELGGWSWDHGRHCGGLARDRLGRGEDLRTRDYAPGDDPAEGRREDGEGGPPQRGRRAHERACDELGRGAFVRMALAAPVLSWVFSELELAVWV